MTLGFRTKWGKPPRPTEFEEKILDGRKKHTLREDPKDRWKAGNSIQFVVGNRTKDRRQFATGECTATQSVYLYTEIDSGRIGIQVNGRTLNRQAIELFVLNDGFDSLVEFDNWFRPLIENAPGKLLIRKLIHWTNLRY
ncbi:MULTISPECIES: hypothetical protein [unclassified Spirosoma]|uniref:hypothetical protein n=1 Tax=unclassified Spirosoma TaxID=2621999 RepID=UPI0009674F0F|nr:MULTISPECIES: hypothetical protein [unclassified Spirosoma]MBN8824422.1 hypothetical protein [Spirosoma sp.]OJW70115.1 MAG: hypothetical protein BGO59_25920 [Spirosoma sp. 48-14]